jgi:hypothetical protein
MGYAPFTHELMCLRNIDIYRGGFTAPRSTVPPLSFSPIGLTLPGNFVSS